LGVWSGRSVAKHVDGAVARVNPGGVDLAPTRVFRVRPGLTIHLRGRERGYLEAGRFLGQAESREPVTPDPEGFYRLEAMALYEARFARVRVPLSATGFCFPRSTLNRLGILKMETAVFDSGYEGEFVASFLPIYPAMVHMDEPLVQLVYMENKEAPRKGYTGFYQGEKAR